jgi:threonine dehydratase
VLKQITQDDIMVAAEVIAPYIRHTPVLHLGPALSDKWSLSLKLENLQVTGAFKARGAFNLLLETSPPGVVAASGGNFGKAIAYAAEVLGIPATIFLPETSPPEKIEAIAAYGANLELVPGFYDQALEASTAFSEANGAFLAHAFDQHEVVAGQGTIAGELATQVPGASTVLVPVGGGGLIGGIANWYRGTVRLVGAESVGCASLHGARQQGEPVEVEVSGVAASALGARKIGEHAWAANEWIDDAVLVDEQSILAAQLWLWERCRLWVEPAAAVGIAAIRQGLIEPAMGDQVVAVISGANVSLPS